MLGQGHREQAAGKTTLTALQAAGGRPLGNSFPRALPHISCNAAMLAGSTAACAQPQQQLRGGLPRFVQLTFCCTDRMQGIAKPEVKCQNASSQGHFPFLCAYHTFAYRPLRGGDFCRPKSQSVTLQLPLPHLLVTNPPPREGRGV